jgi:hypothetical protein
MGDTPRVWCVLRSGVWGLGSAPPLRRTSAARAVRQMCAAAAARETSPRIRRSVRTLVRGRPLATGRDHSNSATSPPPITSVALPKGSFESLSLALHLEEKSSPTFADLSLAHEVKVDRQSHFIWLQKKPQRKYFIQPSCFNLKFSKSQHNHAFLQSSLDG